MTDFKEIKEKGELDLIKKLAIENAKDRDFDKQYYEREELIWWKRYNLNLHDLNAFYDWLTENVNDHQPYFYGLMASQYLISHPTFATPNNKMALGIYMRGKTLGDPICSVYSAVILRCLDCEEESLRILQDEISTRHNPYALYEIANFDYKSIDMKMKMNYLDQVISSDTATERNKYVGLFKKAWYYGKMKDYKKAIYYYSRVNEDTNIQKLDIQLFHTSWNTAICYERIGMPADAIIYYCKAFHIYNNSGMKLKEDQKNSCIRQIKRILNNNSHLKHAILKLGIEKKDKGKFLSQVIPALLIILTDSDIAPQFPNYDFYLEIILDLYQSVND